MPLRQRPLDPSPQHSWLLVLSCFRSGEPLARFEFSSHPASHFSCYVRRGTPFCFLLLFSCSWTRAGLVPGMREALIQAQATHFGPRLRWPKPPVDTKIHKGVAAGPLLRPGACAHQSTNGGSQSDTLCVLGTRKALYQRIVFSKPSRFRMRTKL